MLSSCNSAGEGETEEQPQTQTQSPHTNESITEAPIAQSTEGTTEEAIESPTPIEIPNLVFGDNFDSIETGLIPQYFASFGGATLKIVTDNKNLDKKIMEIGGRDSSQNGVFIDLSEYMTENRVFRISADIKHFSGSNTLPVYCKLDINENELIDISYTSSISNEWSHIEGSVCVPEGAESAYIYFEAQWDDLQTKNEFSNFYLKDITVVELLGSDAEAVKYVPSLYTAYEDFFSIGFASTPSDYVHKDFITKHFNSITPGNELKPDSLLDYETSVSNPEYNTSPAIKTKSADAVLKFALDNNLKMRGHTLVWHSQTPRWFFTENYSKQNDAPLVSKEVMLLRMENYIKQVLQYCQTNYPGVIYAWDVVNEAVEPAHKTDGYRSEDSYWYQIIGGEYVEKAFEYARRYADPEVLLFYNDYNEYISSKRDMIYKIISKLKENGLIDGIGMQSHILMEFPSLYDYESTVKKFSELELEIHVTELDVSLEYDYASTYEEQRKRYSDIFEILIKYKKLGANITNVTIWGLTDGNSWLNKDGPNYPLLFNDSMQPKSAFFGLIELADTVSSSEY